MSGKYFALPVLYLAFIVLVALDENCLSVCGEFDSSVFF
jgi:hypothetical protein